MNAIVAREKHSVKASCQSWSLGDIIVKAYGMEGKQAWILYDQADQ